MDLCPSYVCFSLHVAGLRRSFRLRKDRQGSSGEPQTPDGNHTEFLIYEEVTQYLPRPGDRPRLIVLIGRFTVGFGDVEDRVPLNFNVLFSRLEKGLDFCNCLEFYNISFITFLMNVEGKKNYSTEEYFICK